VEDEDVLNAQKKELSDEGPDENKVDSAATDQHGTHKPTSVTAASERRSSAERKRKIFLEFALKNPSSRDKRGRTFLHHAVEHTNIKTIEELLSKDYDIEAKDAAGLTPLHLALLDLKDLLLVRRLKMKEVTPL
jgi:ankyrin repeat protein